MKDAPSSSPVAAAEVEASNPELTQPSNSFTVFANTINGKACLNGKKAQAINPSTRCPLWDVPVATGDDIENAVNAAKEAFETWSRTHWNERAKYLNKAKEALMEIRDDMAEVIMQEAGKPLQFAKMEVDHSARFLKYHSSHPELETRVVTDNDELRLTIKYVPMGVVAAICPSIHPLLLAVAKIGAALITGNTVIVKPSPFTPYSTLKFVDYIKSIFPPGVLQALNGDEMLGPALVEHPDIQKIAFTGSTATGKKVMAAASKTLKRVTLGLSGNNACIICPDIDVSVVAPQVSVGAFLNSGQSCLATRRIYIHEEIYQEFMQHMIDVVKLWKASPSIPGAGNVLGPIQNESRYRTVKQIVEESKRKGLTFALGNAEFDADNHFVIQPVIIDNPPHDSRVLMEEAFGPIISLFPWKDEAEVISWVNDAKTGLGASIWSGDMDHAVAIGEQIQAGMVTINSHPAPLPSGYLSGWKESGLGGELGTEGLLSYCNAQTMYCYKLPVAPGSAEAD
ncbi:Aldehyde dehydrogenase, cytosolic 1 [Talaromyces pinophilus]|nr:Aldehyde dehydrogenase, cytosolic 1 [Talaromyces pinophilus]